MRVCAFVQVNFSKGHSAVVDNSAIKEGFMKVRVVVAVCLAAFQAVRESEL